MTLELDLKRADDGRWRVTIKAPGWHPMAATGGDPREAVSNASLALHRLMIHQFRLAMPWENRPAKMA